MEFIDITEENLNLNRGNLYLIGLTGGLASGKSTVSNMIRDEGLVVLDADIFAREVVSRGSFGLWALVQLFGVEILDGDKLNRPVLASKLFSDEKTRLKIERVTHPLIQWRAQQEIAYYRHAGAPLIFYDAALLYEKNMEKQFDEVAVVFCPPETQVQRLISRDKVTKEVAQQRLSSQWPIEKKRSQASHVIDNSGTREETKKQVLAWLAALKEIV